MNKSMRYYKSSLPFISKYIAHNDLMKDKLKKKLHINITITF